MASEDTPKPACRAYIDGFNLYYGMLSEHPEHKWLNCRRLIELLRPNEEVEHIKYFTAQVAVERHQSEQRDRQKRYWKALNTLGGFEIVLGKIAKRERECKVMSCPNRTSYDENEEKQTDVNLALHMVADAIDHHPDVMVLISGDSDLVPAVRMVRQRSPQTKVAVYVPSYLDQLPKRRVDEYRGLVQTIKPIPEKFIRQAQFPAKLTGPDDKIIEPPNAWK